MKRRKTRAVKIGKVAIGGDAPISIQSMAKTDARDIVGTVAQIERLEREGCQIVRVACPDRASAEAIKKIRENMHIPLVADIHFNYKLAIIAMDSGADAVRLNPGNVRRREGVEEVVRCARAHGVPVRVGVNAGSLNSSKFKVQSSKLKDKKLSTPNLQLSTACKMVQSALDYIKIFEDMDFYDIIVSLKSSDVPTTIEAYRMMAKRCEYPFHLGVTATGLPRAGVIKSAVGVGSLLAEGIGDTIRISLTGDPLEEVRAAKEILQALGLRYFGPEIIACPTCGRTQVDVVKIATEIKNKLSTRYSLLSTNRPFRIAIMGCVVNGPGEARDADIGIAGGRGSGIIFKKGRKARKVKEKDLVDELLKEFRKLAGGTDRRPSNDKLTATGLLGRTEAGATGRRLNT